ncbi:phospholipase D family protein [Gallaecimonas kandeliae]|uniref:phospholipase D family protein n=1 Tax=Gallaecimonas kandeliae TaxID=3029055 RepID=UPI00264723C8|nr:phospholipase D family protein [Gallaecimonas kandeliae]WKE65787.1 phospholipase D family protein [Gallaecimonas kandeliae]
MLLSPKPDLLLEALIPVGSTAVVLLSVMESTRSSGIRLDRLISEAGIPLARRQDVFRVLQILARQNWLIERDGYWQRTKRFEPTLRWRLTGALQALASRENEQADIVLTQGSHARALRDAISTCVPCSPILRTDELFREMVSTTPKGSPVYFVMPFFDEEGLCFLGELTRHVPEGSKIRLITRVQQIEDELRLKDLQSKAKHLLTIRIYQRAAEKGYETFHAKLVAHNTSAYVGSANLTRASLGISAELGIHLKSRSAETVFQLADVLWGISEAIE